MVGFVRSEACAGLIDADEASPVRELASAAGAAGTGISKKSSSAVEHSSSLYRDTGNPTGDSRSLVRIRLRNTQPLTLHRTLSRVSYIRYLPSIRHSLKSPSPRSRGAGHLYIFIRNLFTRVLIIPVATIRYASPTVSRDGVTVAQPRHASLLPIIEISRSVIGITYCDSRNQCSVRRSLGGGTRVLVARAENREERKVVSNGLIELTYCVIRFVG